MFYLIGNKSVIKNYLHSPQLVEIQDLAELSKALFNKIYSGKTSFNADFLISYSEFKRLPNIKSKYDDEVIEFRLKKISSYKKKNIDFFILESSTKLFNKTKLKLTKIAESAGIKLDCTTLSSENLLRLKNDFNKYYLKFDKSPVSSAEEFFKIKDKFNSHKILNMNRLTTKGLYKFDDWFENGYVSYRHVLFFARNELNISSGKTEEKSLFRLFGYLPSDNEYFSDDAMRFIKSLVKKSGFTTHKLAMMLEYYIGNTLGDDKYCDFKPRYEYLLFGARRNIDRKFLIYLSLALGLSISSIKTLFKKCNCVLTDYLKEDILLRYFAENDYLIETKQRGSLFRYLRVSK